MVRPVLRLLLLATLAVGALPAQAGAAVVLTDGCPFFLCAATVTGVSADDQISVQNVSGQPNHTRFVASGASAAPWDLSGASTGTCSQAPSGANQVITCTTAYFVVGVNGGDGHDNLYSSRSTIVNLTGGGGDDVLSLSGGPNGATVNGDAGDDTITGSAQADTLNGGAGSDFIDALAGGDTITGGDGDDRIQGGDGADAIDGGAGRDLMSPGTGADDVIGGEGFDGIGYTERSESVSVTLDDVADDGVSGEGDNAHADIEDIAGGRGGDTLVGNEAGNHIDGRAGNDSITGNGGQDSLVGGDGDDTLRARDGTRENLDCGAGADFAIGDQVDLLVDCESQDLSADLVPDFDGDGVVKPTDCNDANAAIRPGATEVPDNGVDEDCDGADAVNLDRDADGSLRPADCNDANASVKPTAKEVPGNTVDEDCSGLADPYPSITSTVVNGFTSFARTTRIDQLKVRNVPSGATVKVTCKGGGCPKKGYSRKLSKKTTTLDVRKPFRRSRLRSGARLEIRVTKSRSIGRVVRFTMRRGKLPKGQALCLPPGKSTPEAC